MKNNKLYSFFMLIVLLAGVIPSAIPTTTAKAIGETVTVEIQPAGSGVKDNMIISSYFGNAGTDTNIGIGEMNTATGDTHRSLLEFDLSGLPKNVSVTSATLSLWVTIDRSSTAATISAYPIIRNWSETTSNWTDYKTTTAWGTAGAGNASDVITTAMGTVDVTATMTAGTRVDMVLDPLIVYEFLFQNYYGMKLQSSVELNDGYYYASSDNATAAQRPMLTITYEVLDPEIPVYDPGWTCIDGTINGYTWPLCDVFGTLSPYVAEHYNSPVHINYGAGTISSPMEAMELQCTPFPNCVNDYDINYRIAYNADWVAVANTTGEFTITWSIPGGTNVSETITCGSVTMEGQCNGIFVGVIPASALPANTDIGYTIGLTARFNFPADAFVSEAWFDWEMVVGISPLPETCTEYAVPEIEAFEIDPAIEFPLGASGVPADQQIYETIAGQYYMVNVLNTWNDGTNDDRNEAKVSLDEGDTWMTWPDFVAMASCVELQAGASEDIALARVYYLATTSSLWIKAADNDGAFGDNSNNLLLPTFQYQIGLAMLIPEALFCDSQFTYSGEDLLSDIVLLSYSTGMEANDDVTNPLTPGAWYAIEIVGDTSAWYEAPATEPRIDLEFKLTGTSATNFLSPTIDVTDWADLTTGSGLVYCVSEDARTVYIQAPLDRAGLSLHLRVNDQDDNFGDNTGLLYINIYESTFTRTRSGCELQYELGDLVDSDTVDGGASNGQEFANTLTNGLGVSYALTPGGWYILETTGGPWTMGVTSGLYTSGQQYYDVQLSDGGTWYSVEAWPLTECSAATDSIGHQRIYFQAPATSAAWSVRVAGAGMLTGGEISWDLYESVNYGVISSPENNCAGFSFDPEVENSWGMVDASLSAGDDIPGLAVDGYFAIQIESANISTDPPFYAYSGWIEAEGEYPQDDMQLTVDGTTWLPLPNHPAVLCYYYTEDDELVYFVKPANGQVLRMRADSTTFSDNNGDEYYTTYTAAPGAELDPWVSCMDEYTATVPALNEQQAIPPQDEEGVNLMPTLTYTPEQDPDGDGIIYWGSPGLESGHDYMVETVYGPWQDGETPTNYYDAQLSSDNGATWYLFADHPDVICATEDQLGWYWKAIFHVDDGEVWKIRVADTTTDVFTDNEGHLAYSLNLVNEFPIDGPGSVATDYDPGAFDVCTQSLVRPQTLALSDIGSLGNYFGDWIQYLNRSALSYFAWCPRHTQLLMSAVNALKTREPLATVAELDAVAKTVQTDVASYDWGDGGFQDTSIFSVNSSSEVNALVNENILPTTGEAYDVWDGGDLVAFNGSSGLPAYYYTCGNIFADYLPSRLRDGVCFASAYWKETGASFWIQLLFDISVIFMLFGMIKGAAQSLIYMMTGVRPWTKDGALKIITIGANEIGAGQLDAETSERRRGLIRTIRRG